MQGERLRGRDDAVVFTEEQEWRGLRLDQIDRVGVGGPVPAESDAVAVRMRSSNPSATMDRSEAPNSSTTARIRGSVSGYGGEVAAIVSGLTGLQVLQPARPNKVVEPTSS
ncbi:MAG: hypothetical protein WAM30_00060 [Candidatus Dormiibacterota bacterium]